MTTRLQGSTWLDFLHGLGIYRLDPVGRTSASGEGTSETAFAELLRKGDPLPPGNGIVAEDRDTLGQLFATAGPTAAFALTPDGHLASHEPLRFDARRAAEQVVALVEADIAVEAREEALTATWVGLAYHNHDHPADFGGLLRDPQNGQPRCCYLDVKWTQAVRAQRAKQEKRAQERKFGLMALTVTEVENRGFAGYPGWGQPGLFVTLLRTQVQADQKASPFAFNVFVGIASNYPASEARWGWGGPRGVKLPDVLLEELGAHQVVLAGGSRSWLELLAACASYEQFRDAEGVWDRECLQATLEAMSHAMRYLLMNENVLEQVQSTLANLQPAEVETPLRLEDYHPGESLASYFGKKADQARREQRLAAEEADKARREQRLAAEEADKARREQRLAAEEAERKLRLAAEEAERKLRLAAEEVDKARREQQLAAEEAKKARREQQLAAERAETAERKLRQAAEESALARSDQHQTAEQLTQANAQHQQSVKRRRDRGHPDAEIAEDLGFSLDEFCRRFPPQP